MLIRFIKILNFFILIIFLSFGCLNYAEATTRLLKTVMPSGGDYTSLEACMNANEQNLVTADKYFDVEIDGTWSSADTTAVTIHNYTTDATRYIHIYTTTAARHKGVLSSSYYQLSVNAADAINLVYANCPDIKILGLQIVNASATGAGINQGRTTPVTNISYIAYNIVVNTNGSNNNAGIAVFRISSYIYNNIVYGGWGYSGITTYSDNTAVQYVYNNTVYGCGSGLKPQSNDTVAKNNICYNNTTDYDNVAYFIDPSTHNLSKDATAPALGTYYINKTLTFTNTGAGTEDFHLVSGDTDAIDLGSDLSGESIFTDDIDGVTRTGTWDIGADEYVATAPSTFSVIFGTNTIIDTNFIIK